MKKEIIISIIFMLFLISCKSIKSSNIDNNIARFKVGSSTEFNVGFFDENKQVKDTLNELPESVKKKVQANANEIKSVGELDELVRRIRTAETGRIF